MNNAKVKQSEVRSQNIQEGLNTIGHKKYVLSKQALKIGHAPKKSLNFGLPQHLPRFLAIKTFVDNLFYVKKSDRSCSNQTL